MIWRRKPEPVRPSELQPIPASDPEQSIADALRAYQEHFYKTIRGSDSEETERARKILERARQIVGQSGLGPALAPTLLEHVKYWPSWSTHDDFLKYVGFPCRYIRGSSETSSEESAKTTIVSFAYKEALYTVRFVDTGMNSWATDDMNAYGTVHFYRDAQEVFGLDIQYDMAKGDAATWRWSDVLAFQPGPWMQDLIEIAGYIEGNFWRDLEERRSADIRARASKITLPE
jgi:hypothetical protein